MANHGGGYSYRLCKEEVKVTEECFQVCKTKQNHIYGNACKYTDASMMSENCAGLCWRRPVGAVRGGRQKGEHALMGKYF